MFEAIAAFLAGIGINVSHLIAGLAGAFVRTVIQGKKLTWEVVSGSFVGAFCAIYMTPLLMKWAELNQADGDLNNGIAFAIGMLGVSLAEGAVRLAQRWASNPKLPRSMDAEGFADAVSQDREEDKKKQDE